MRDFWRHFFIGFLFLVRCWCADVWNARRTIAIVTSVAVAMISVFAMLWWAFDSIFLRSNMGLEASHVFSFIFAFLITLILAIWNSSIYWWFWNVVSWFQRVARSGRQIERDRDYSLPDER